MKKNKIIIPAMAMILFSTAASISGTVAWFTANRVFQTTVGNFSVVETEGSLDCTMGASIGTALSGENIIVDSNNVLTHGSVDIASGKAYIVDPDSPIANPTYEDHRTHDASSGDGLTWLYKDNAKVEDTSHALQTVDIYVAVAWTMTFTYTFNGDTNPVAVYLDRKQSTFSDTVSPSPDFQANAVDQNTDTAKGFRIGFFGAYYGTPAEKGASAANAHNVVWGNNVPAETVPDAWNDTHGELPAGSKVLRDDGIIYSNTTLVGVDGAWVSSNWKATGEISLAKSKTCDAKYVTGTSAGSLTDYTASNYIWTDDSYNRHANNWEAENASPSASNAEKICTLTTNKDTVTVVCAAWFEGTDPNVITGSEMECMSATMTFYSRSVNPSA